MMLSTGDNMKFQALTDTRINITSSLPKEREPYMMSPRDIKKIKFFLEDHDIFWICNDAQYRNSMFDKYDKIIGDFQGCDVTIVNDENSRNLYGKYMKDVWLYVDNENNLFANYMNIVSNVHGTIDLKMKPMSKYNPQILLAQLSMIRKHIEQTFSISPIIVKQLSGFLMQEKFNDYGYNTFFISPDLNIWVHPMFYYMQDERGKVGDVVNTEIENEFNHYSRPHLMCESCDTFYCNRSVYDNLTEIGDIKTPADSTCKETKIFDELSKELYNRLNRTALESKELGDADSFKSQDAYDAMSRDQIISNTIKRVNFIEDHIYGVDKRLDTLDNIIKQLNKAVQELYHDNINR